MDLTNLLKDLTSVPGVSGLEDKVARVAMDALSPYVDELYKTPMGAVVGIVFWVPYKLLPGVFDRYLMSAVLTMVSVLIGVIVYAIIYTKSTGMTDAEIRRLPMGTKILVLLRKLHAR